MKLSLFILILFLLCCETRKSYPDGGYNYPNAVEEKDSNFFYFPIKEILSKRDSLKKALAYKWYKEFDEPNISLKPLDEEVFRFTYTGFKELPTIITLTNQQIIVKIGNRGDVFENFEDVSRLTELEREHLYFLKRWYPIDTTGKKQLVKAYIDSTVKLYPQLLNTKYYLELITKAIGPNQKAFTYTKKIIRLSKESYRDLINTINKSGYWTLPHKIECKYDMTDGYGFMLEANTKEKYNLVAVAGCPNDNSKFTQACQKLIDLAKMGKMINLVWDGSLTTDPTTTKQ